MNKYEMTIILKPNLDEEVQKAEFEKISALVTRFGGTVDKVDEWGKRRLAYEIEKFSEGVYRFFTFTSDSTCPAEVESRVRIMESVLRYLVIRLED